MRKFLIAAALIAGPALAQAPQPAQTATPAPVDPTRMPAARQLATRIVPAGTYQRIMKDMMPGLIGRMMDGMLDMPIKQLATSLGLGEEEVTKLGTGTTRQITAILDPNFKERTQLTMQAIFAGMGNLFTQLEPDLREGLAIGYARRFDVAQLGELNRFFDTPTGSAFAAQQLAMMNDPDVMQKMQGFMPALLKQMPEIMKHAQAATASLPKPKTAADLTDADRAKLAQLLSVPPEKLKVKGAAK